MVRFSIGAALLLGASSATAFAQNAMSDAARAFRAAIEVTTPLRSDAATHYVGLDNDEIDLAIGDVFDQGGTQWCWAYSAYHTLRGYYLTTDAADATTVAWKDALTELDSANAFRGYMSQHFSTGRTGEPGNFILSLSREEQLTEPEWKTYWSSSRAKARWSDGQLGIQHAEETVSIRTIEAKIFSSLSAGVPLAYCYPPHCVTIYGGVYDGERALEYFIADSSGGRTYRADARRALGRLDLIMTKQ